MNSSTRTIFQLRPASFLKTLSILGLFIIVISYSYWSHLANIKSVFTHTSIQTQAQTQQQPSEEKLKLANSHNWQQKIWQTSKHPLGNISTENEVNIKTWIDLNPGYQHTLLIDESILGYVKEHFHARNPDIEETILQARQLDFVLVLDLVKYMVLWAEGGVYSDLDVACGKPVGEWVPERFRGEAGVVLGVGKVGGEGGVGEEFGLVDWTVMAKPNQPFFWFVYQRFRENVRRLAAEEMDTGMDSRPYNVSDVTGRNALTQAFLAYATSVTGTKVTSNNFTEFSEPTLFGEILVLPVQTFDSLVHHYEAGSWKSEPWDKLQTSVNKEQKMEEPEQEKVAEKEKQKQEDMKTTGGDQDAEEDNKGEVSEEEETAPAGNSTTSADVSTKGTPGQKSVNGTAEPIKPQEEGNKASPADENAPTSDKPPSVQYENAQAKGKSTTNDKPPSVQYENAKVAGNVTKSKNNTTSQQSTNDNTNTTQGTDKDAETKAEEESQAKEEAEILKAQAATQALEQEEIEAAAKEAAEAQEKEEEEKRIAEAQEKEEEEKAAEAEKKKEEEERSAEEEEEKKKAVEPKWAPLNEAGVLASSNNLADYGAEFVPDE